MTRLFPAALSVIFMLPVAALGGKPELMTHTAVDQGATDHAAAISPGVTEGGQAAFAAIEEIVALLAANPSTDWKRVDVEALRQHLIDMDNVTLRAHVSVAPTDAGVRFDVWSDDAAVRTAIQRMVSAHVTTMNGVNGWELTTAKTERGAVLDVAANAADTAMLQGLGFIGVMTLGAHHQSHHWAIAVGQNPHN